MIKKYALKNVYSIYRKMTFELGYFRGNETYKNGSSPPNIIGQKILA